MTAPRRPIPIVFAALTVCAVGLGAQAAHSQPALPTPQFIHAAAATDAFERDAGKLAEHRAKSGKVKMFGMMMVRDHAKTTAGLKKAIMKAHMPPPPPPMLTADQMKMMDGLKAAHGREFDTLYIQDQVMAHQEALGAMQGYAKGGDAPPIREAAMKTVPIVQHHLMEAQKIQAGLR